MTLSAHQPNDLALYHYDSCPFCAKTRHAIHELDLSIELRNIQKNHNIVLNCNKEETKHKYLVYVSNKQTVKRNGYMNLMTLLIFYVVEN